MSRLQLQLGRELGKGSEGRVFEVVGKNQVCKVLNAPYQEGVLPNEIMMHYRVFQCARNLNDHVIEPHACLVHMNGQIYYGLILDRLSVITYPFCTDSLLGASSCALFQYINWAVFTLSLLQKSGVVHGDIKPANIMKGAEGRRKLIDFGVAQTYEAFQQSTTEVGALTICSPEYLAGNRQYPFQADVWAMGKFLIGLLGLPDIFTLLQENISGSVLDKAVSSSGLQEDVPNLGGVLCVIGQKIGCFESLNDQLDPSEIAAVLEAEREKLRPGMGFFPMFFQIVGQMLSIHPALRPSVKDLYSAIDKLREECRQLKNDQSVSPSFRGEWVSHLCSQYGMDSLQGNLPFEDLFARRAVAASAEQKFKHSSPASSGNHARFAFAGEGQNTPVEIEYLTLHFPAPPTLEVSSVP